MRKVHFVGPASGSHRTQIDGVLEHLRLRHLRVDDLKVPQRVDAHDATAARVEIAHDLAEILIGDDDFHVHDRLEQDRRSFGHPLLEGQMRRRLEGHFRRIDVVIRTEIKRRFEVHRRERRQHAFVQALAQSFFDGGDVLSRHGASGDLVFEDEALSPLQGAELDINVAVLAVAAGLLFVLALRLGRLADRFAIRDLRHAGLQVDAEAILQLGENDVEMKIAHAGKDVVVRFRVLFEADGGIFFGDAAHRRSQLVLVGPTLGIDGDRIHRTREFDGRIEHGAAGLAHRVAGPGALQLGNGDDHAGRDFFDVDAVLALHDLEGADALLLAGADVENRFVGGQFAGIDADIGKFAHVGIDQDFEAQTAERGVIVRFDRDLLLLSLDRRTLAHFKRAGKIIDDQIHELADADVFQRGTGHDGEDLALVNAALQDGKQFVDGDVLAVEITHHHLFVFFDNGFDKIAAGAVRVADHVFGDPLLLEFSRVVAVNVSDVLEDVDDAFKGIFAADREHEAVSALGQIGADLFINPVIVGVFAIHFIDEENGRRFELLRKLPGFFRLHFNAVDRAHDHNGGTGDAQRTAQVANEVGIAGNVKDKDFFALVVVIQEGGAYGNLAFLFFGRVIRNGVPVFHAAAAGRDAGVKKQRFRKRSFACASVSNNRDTSYVFRFHSHISCQPPR